MLTPVFPWPLYLALRVSLKLHTPKKKETDISLPSFFLLIRQSIEQTFSLRFQVHNIAKMLTLNVRMLQCQDLLMGTAQRWRCSKVLKTFPLLQNPKGLSMKNYLEIKEMKQ